MTKPSVQTDVQGDYAFGSEPLQEQRLNDDIANGVLGTLVANGFLPQHEPIDWASFRQWQALVHQRFEVPVSSITTRMSRLLYAISCASRPRTIVCAGSAWGNALVWLAAGSPDAAVTGIDIDAEASAVATRNFAAIGREVRILVEDARTASDRLEPVDLLFLDADDADTGKGILVPILDSLDPVLHQGTLVLAHDASLPTFAEDFVAYRAAVVARRARRTMNVPIDRCGLEVTLL